VDDVLEGSTLSTQERGYQQQCDELDDKNRNAYKSTSVLEIGTCGISIGGEQRCKDDKRSDIG